MKFIIAGAGSVGYDVARHLIKAGKDVVIIEKNPVRAKFLENDLDCIVLNSEVNSIQTLRDVNIEDGDYFIAVTESDEVNLISCSVASTIGDIKKIARVRNLDYSHAEVQGRPFLGADYIINPEIEAAKQLTERIDKGAATDVLTFHGLDITARGNIVTENSIFSGKKLHKIKSDLKSKFVAAFIKRDNEDIIPTGDTVVKTGDNIYIVADNEVMNHILSREGKKLFKVEKILIVGTTRIARNLMRTLAQKNVNMTVIVDDYTEAKEIARTFPEVLVLNGDVRDEKIFEEENLSTYDLIVSVTESQELNVLTALYSKSIGIKRAVATVNKPNYISIAKKLGVDVTVSPKRSAVDAILKFIRKGQVKTFYSLFDGDAEAIEFIIPENCKVNGKTLQEIKMPRDSIVVAANRDSEAIVPDGSYKIKSGDHMVVVYKSSSASKIESLFSGN